MQSQNYTNGSRRKSSLWKYLLFWGALIAIIIALVFTMTGVRRSEIDWTRNDVENYFSPYESLNKDDNVIKQEWQKSDIATFFTSSNDDDSEYVKKLNKVTKMTFYVGGESSTFVINYSLTTTETNDLDEQVTITKNYQASYNFTDETERTEIATYIINARNYITNYLAKHPEESTNITTGLEYNIVNLFDINSFYSQMTEGQKEDYYNKLSYVESIRVDAGPYKSTLVVDYYRAGANARPTYYRASYTFVANDGGLTVNYINQLIDNANAFLIAYKNDYNPRIDVTLYIGVKDTTERSFWLDLLISLLPIIICGVLIFIIISKASGGNKSTMEFGNSKARREDNSPVRFRDVAGCDDEKEEMKELVDYLKNPTKYRDSGARIPKGIILKGPPGTGKTLLAKAVAGEANVPFYYISGSDFLEMFVGVGASRVRDMFKRARSTAPCIIFIDEIDAVARQRGSGLGGGHDEREQTLNQLLVEMDGFEGNTGVIVLAATNRIDILDPALLRPGRFDRQIDVNLPDLKGRVEILKVHARNKKLASDVSLESVAKRTPGFSGAELENVLNEAAILSVRNRHERISTSDIDEAVDRVMAGPAKKTKVISERAKKMVAYHEAGHAVIGLKVALSETVQKITIIPRGDAGGYVLMTPKDESMLQTKGELLAKITSYLAGRASEEIFFDDVTTGAHSDIERATQIARTMVTELGMSSLGPVQYENGAQQVFLGRDYGSTRISSEVANEIDKAVREIIESCLETARKCILENKDILILIAENLLKYETITAEEINYLIEHGSLDEYKAEQEKNATLKNQETNTTIKPVDSANEPTKEDKPNEPR